MPSIPGITGIKEQVMVCLNGFYVIRPSELVFVKQTVFNGELKVLLRT